jgi:formylmethanofuran dehydrogenase subunit D
MRMRMNTGRTVRQGEYVEEKFSAEYADETATCYVHPLDLFEMDIENETIVEVAGPAGSVVLKALASEDVDEGTIFVPYGPFANFITPPSTHSSGMPDFKNVWVEVLPASGERVSPWELMERLGGLRYED